ncbi:MAG: hypothetical protein U9Q99_03095 [Nanoarchaeota archaeon]|nr:hypothetical protein [Nanoarchaeota archaeon]
MKNLRKKWYSALILLSLGGLSLISLNNLFKNREIKNSLYEKVSQYADINKDSLISSNEWKKSIF